MRLILVAGGTVEREVLLRVIRAESPEDLRIMACDAGVTAVEAERLRPDYVVGDFDSVSEEEKLRIRKTYPAQRILKPVKDDTDMEAAVRWAIELRPASVILLGATGTRLDHTLTNLRMLVLFRKAGIRAEILDSHNRIRVIDGPVKLRKKDVYGTYISLLPVTETVEGIDLTGFRYPLEQGTIPMIGSLGVSNELKDDEGEIHFSKGMLYLMETKDR